MQRIIGVMMLKMKVFKNTLKTKNVGKFKADERKIIQVFCILILNF